MFFVKLFIDDSVRTFDHIVTQGRLFKILRYEYEYYFVYSNPVAITGIVHN
jgi:hypothetical protein